MRRRMEPFPCCEGERFWLGTKPRGCSDEAVRIQSLPHKALSFRVAVLVEIWQARKK